MASSRKKRSRAVITVLLCLAAVCIVAALVLYSLVDRKLKAIQQGADFTFTYAVTSQGGTTHPALYSILDQAGATEGRMSGLYSPGQLQLYLYSRDAAMTETSGDNFFTDIYIDADQTLFNAGKLYRTLRDSVASSYPLVGTFFPEWSLPNYISQSQLAQILGVPDSQVAMQEMSGYTLKLDPKWIVRTDYDTQGFTYFQFPSEGVGSPTLVLGLPLKSLLFDDSIPVDIHLEIPAHDVSVTLTGSVTPVVNSFSVPTDVIQDSDIAAFVQLRQTMEQIAQIIQSTLNAIQ